MKLPRNVSGSDLEGTLCRRWGYRKVHQVGSHMILQTEDPSHHRIAIPAHKTLRIGTLNGLLRAVASHKGVERQAVVDSL